MGLRSLPDTLVGRMETVELWPLSQGEIDGEPDGFVDAVYQLGAEFRHTSTATRRDYIDRIIRGGFPEAVSSYLGLLEEVFLIKGIPAWSRSITSRAVKTPKLAFVDSGMAAHLLGADTHRLRQPGAPLGPLLENFVSMELARQLSWSRMQADLHHYRTKDKIEVDIVLENRQGRVVAAEVKAAETVKPEDFKGLRHLSERLGDDLVVGMVLYTGRHTLQIDSNLLAVPISALWESAAD